MIDTRLARVVIVGGGFGGLYAAFTLGRKPVQITVVDRKNYHLFQPFLYQVATAGLSPGDIAQPIRHILQDFPNVTVLMAEVASVGLAERQILMADGSSLPYDFLIMAAGASHSYFGHEDWATHAPGLKTIEDALEIRKRILSAFEKAEREEDAERRQAFLTFVIVGAGPTGVELAGAIVEIARHAMVREFRHIDPRRARILLLEAAPRVLPGFDPILSGAAAKELARLGVEVHANTAVTRICPGYVEAGGSRIPTGTVDVVLPHFQPRSPADYGRRRSMERSNLENAPIMRHAQQQAGNQFPCPPHG